MQMEIALVVTPGRWLAVVRCPSCRKQREARRRLERSARFIPALSSFFINLFVISSLVVVAAPIADLTCTAMYLS